MCIFDHNFSINSPCVVDCLHVLAVESFSGQVSSVLGKVFIDENIIMSRVFGTMFLMFFLALNTRSRTLHVANLTTWRGWPESLFPTLWDTAMSVGRMAGSTLILLHRLKTAASVSSFSLGSGRPKIRRLFRLPCCSSWSSLIFCSSIIFQGLNFTTVSVYFYFKWL